MASVSTQSNGRRCVQVIVGPTRHSIRLGKVSAKDASTACGHIEHLMNAKTLGAPIPQATAEWLKILTVAIRQRIAKAGLCEPVVIERQQKQHPTDAHPLSIRGIVDAYMNRRTDLKPGTIVTMRHAAARFVSIIGAERLISGVHVSQAKDCHRHALGKYSRASVAKMVKVARQVWEDAIERRIIHENPWRKIKAGSMENPSRLRFIDRATIDKVIELAPTVESRLMISLARYAGLRCPSEHHKLKWSDIDWAENRMLIHSPKTDRHANKHARWIPIFPEVLPHLQAAFDAAEPGQVFVFKRRSAVNYRTSFERMIKRAGFTPWPKLFQNLRATRETELAAEFPLHVVCQWIGNDVMIAKKHYLQVTDADFQKAAPRSEKKAVQKAVQLTWMPKLTPP